MLLKNFLILRKALVLYPGSIGSPALPTAYGSGIDSTYFRRWKASQSSNIPSFVDLLSQ